MNDEDECGANAWCGLAVRDLPGVDAVPALGTGTQTTGHTQWRTLGCSAFCGFQSGRQDPGLGELGQDHQAVGREEGQGTGHPQGTHGNSDVCGLQSGRQDSGLGELGQDDQALGCGDKQGTSHPQGTHRLGEVCGFQSGWQDSGLGGTGTKRSSCGTWQRARNRPPSRDTRTQCWPWPSVRTARRWPREAR